MYLYLYLYLYPNLVPDLVAVAVPLLDAIEVVLASSLLLSVQERDSVCD